MTFYISPDRLAFTRVFGIACQGDTDLISRRKMSPADIKWSRIRELIKIVPCFSGIGLTTSEVQCIPRRNYYNELSQQERNAHIARVALTILGLGLLLLPVILIATCMKLIDRHRMAKLAEENCGNIVRPI